MMFMIEICMSHIFFEILEIFVIFTRGKSAKISAQLGSGNRLFIIQTFITQLL